MQQEGTVSYEVEPDKIAVSDAIRYFTSRVEILDLEVSDISTESLVAGLYKEYQI